MFSKGKKKFIPKKKILFGLIAFLLGVLVSGVGVHFFDAQKVQENKKTVAKIVGDSNTILDLDAYMFGLHYAARIELVNCIENESTCDHSKIMSDLQLAEKTNVGLAKHRSDMIDQISALYKEYQRLTP